VDTTHPLLVLITRNRKRLCETTTRVFAFFFCTMMFASSAVRAASRQVISAASRRTFSAAATKVVQKDASRKALLATTAGLALAVAVLQDREVRVEQVMSRSYLYEALRTIICSHFFCFVVFFLFPPSFFIPLFTIASYVSIVQDVQFVWQQGCCRHRQGH
jgi:Sec-independent protein secretion pathway component TatC